MLERKTPLRPLYVHKGINANPFLEESEAHHETSRRNGIANLGILKERK
jgi:hypothetical protein